MPKKKQTLILDIGAGSIKSGFNNEKEPKIIDNCIFKAKNVSNKTYIGSELNDCNNLSGLFLYMPFKKGYINNWELEKQILDNLTKHIFNKDRAIEESNIIVTEPIFNFASTRETMQEILFEEYQCSGLIVTSAPFLADFKHRKTNGSDWSFVVDSGYSYTTLVPFHNGVPIYSAIKRISIGGKIVTNRLVEVISYGQLDVRSEVFIMNQCKEDVCFVSNNFWQDLTRAKSKDRLVNDKRLKYILPDYVNTRRGYIDKEPLTTKSSATDSQYAININNERFVVPELLFHPADVGYSEMGVSEGSAYILNECLSDDAAARVGCADNVLLTGGSCCFPGFKDRVYSDLRASTPDDFPVTVYKDDNPRLAAWYGGQMLANDSDAMERYLVTRKEYTENGAKYCEDKYPI